MQQRSGIYNCVPNNSEQPSFSLSVTILTSLSDLDSVTLVDTCLFKKKKIGSMPSVEPSVGLEPTTRDQDPS